MGSIGQICLLNLWLSVSIPVFVGVLAIYLREQLSYMWAEPVCAYAGASDRGCAQIYDAVFGGADPLKEMFYPFVVICILDTIMDPLKVAQPIPPNPLI